MSTNGTLKTYYKGKDASLEAVVDGKTTSLKLAKSKCLTQDKFQNHAEDTTAHVTSAQHEELHRLIGELLEPPVPEGAFYSTEIASYFAENAQPGELQAPAAVYVSRVPYARMENNAWVNNASVVDEAVFGCPRKFMDNLGLAHACSTDTVEGVDDYAGLWSFFWQHGNYVVDEYGTKFITAIKRTRC